MSHERKITAPRSHDAGDAYESDGECPYTRKNYSAVRDFRKYLLNIFTASPLIGGRDYRYGFESKMVRRAAASLVS